MSSDEGDGEYYDQEEEYEETGEEPAAAADPEKKKKRRANKPKRDPEKPRGALSAYMCFSKNIRPAILEQHPGSSVTEVAKLVGQKWKELSEDDKVPFQAMAAQDKKRYEKEMSDYEPTPGYEKATKRRKKDPNAPKRPKSAYFLFSDTRRNKLREENPDWKIAQVAQATGVEWKSLSEEDKKPFHEQAAELKAKYDEAVAAYKSQ